MDAWLADLAHAARFAFETAGILVILVGSLVAISLAGRDYFTGRHEMVAKFRARLGRSILIGLEFLVAGDIINTVAFEPTLRSVAVLAGIVAIRTFLSFSLEAEINGRWPWKRQEQD